MNLEPRAAKDASPASQTDEYLGAVLRGDGRAALPGRSGARLGIDLKRQSTTSQAHRITVSLPGSDP